MDNIWHHGSCLCSKVTFHVRNINEHIGHCHCTMCRKFHGAAFSTYGEVIHVDFEWLTGQDAISIYESANKTKRQFCKDCGSSLTFETPKDSSRIEFSLSLLDDHIDLKPDAHIFTDFKADFYPICDDLPCYREGRDSELKRPL